jgi:sortase A
MPEHGSKSTAAPPLGRPGRAVLFFGALVLIGLGCVATALAGIAESNPAPVAYASIAQTKRAASSLDNAYRPRPVAAPKTGRKGAPNPAATRAPRVAQQRGPVKGMTIGYLVIPALERTLPIIEGTDTPELNRGVGHFARSAMPGEPNNCVLSGHRDTVFTRLGEVGVGSQLVACTTEGAFTYVVRQVRIVGKDDKTVIVPTDHAVLTVTTCYPFRYVGAAPDRYVLVADLVSRR